jgi:vacuolar-type H+-ATPase subunit E/Vma4
VDSLSEKDIIGLLIKRLKKAAILLGPYSLTARYSGISKSSAAQILSSGLGKGDIELSPAEGFRGLLLEAKNGRVVYRLRMEELIEDLREYHREAVISAVFKGNR